VTVDVAPLLAGVAAGYGVAMPMGAISVLIMHEGLTRGWRTAWAAASGTALVDLGYVTLALAAGAAVTDRLQGHARTVQLVGAAVLVVVVVRGLLGLRRTALPIVTGAREPIPAPAADRSGSRPGALLTARRAGPGSLRTLRRFVALTAVNPLTAVYFVVLTAGLAGTVHGTTAAVAFACGVFLASWSWASMLAALGSLAGARLPEWARTATSLGGYLVVLGYAARLALS
jgi:threonine/homoserine/homoserine lactone efflux protein